MEDDKKNDKKKGRKTKKSRKSEKKASGMKFYHPQFTGTLLEIDLCGKPEDVNILKLGKRGAKMFNDHNKIIGTNMAAIRSTGMRMNMAPKNPSEEPPGLGIEGSINIPMMNIAAISAAIRVLSVVSLPVPIRVLVNIRRISTTIKNIRESIANGFPPCGPLPSSREASIDIRTYREIASIATARAAIIAILPSLSFPRVISFPPLLVLLAYPFRP